MQISGRDAMRQLMYLWCLFVVCACSASPSNNDEDLLLREDPSLDKQEGDPPEVDINTLGLEELKKRAVVYTFEDVKAMERKEVFNNFIEPNVIWMKDFKNWKIDELDPKVIVEIIDIFHLHNRALYKSGKDSVVYIDDNEKIHNVTPKQLKASASKVRSGGFCGLDDHPNFFPVEYITQLSPEELWTFQFCLTEEQLMALSDEQIIGSRIFYTYDNKVPFSPEKVKTLWLHMAYLLYQGETSDEIWRYIKGMRVSCEVFQFLNKKQVQILDPDQINDSKPEGYADWLNPPPSSWCWRHEQWSWFTPDQLKGISFVETDDRGRKEHLFISRAIVENLSDDQLRAFSKEQIEGLVFRDTKYFSAHQLKVLQENGATNKFMERAIYYQDQGPDIFDNYPDDLSQHRLLKYLTSLTPEQFSSLREAQAMSFNFEDPLRLRPEQISYFPHFVKILNFSDSQFDRTYAKLQNSLDRIEQYFERNRSEWTTDYALEVKVRHEQDDRRYGFLLEYRRHYDSLNHVKLLSRDQVRSIPAEQIPEIPLHAFYILYTRNYDGYNRKHKQEEYEAPLTPEQFASMSSEQFDYIFGNDDWKEEIKYLSDEVLEVLSLERIDYLLEEMSYYFSKYANPKRAKEFGPIRDKLLKIKENL